MGDWVNNREAGDLRRYLAHYDVIVMHTRGKYFIHGTKYRKLWNSHWWGILEVENVIAFIGLVARHIKENIDIFVLKYNLKQLECLHPF